MFKNLKITTGIIAVLFLFSALLMLTGSLFIRLSARRDSTFLTLNN